MERIAIIGGVRTPFVKAAGAFVDQSTLDLGVHVVKSLWDKLKLQPNQVDELIFSTVLLDPRVPNLAREIVLRSGLPKTLSAHFMGNNCISGLVAATQIADGIRSGRIRSGLAGGAESMSRPALTFHPKAEKFFLRLARARSLGERLGLLAGYRMKFGFPVPPSPKEPSTGLTMGQHCEITAKEFGITREAQDQVAFRSHQNAAQAQTKGYLAQEIVPFAGVDKDNLVRADTSLERLAKLKPVFDRSAAGTLTAGNSSALTDGASVVCLMAESEARAQGRQILGYIEQTAYSAIDPADGLLMAPAVALPELLERAKVSLNQIDRFEIHEAFGAQVLANQAAWKSGWKKYPKAKAIGEIDPAKINVNGGSIALGHPFAATGGRLIMATVAELERSGGKLGVISVCAAGAMGCAMLIRRD